MEYNLDTQHLSLRDYREILKTQNLLPSRMVLLQNLDERFSWFENNGTTHVAQLKKNLSTPQKITALARNSGIPEAYLVILKREIGSLEQKLVPLGSFPGIDDSMVKRLQEEEINNSKEYWERNQSNPDELFCLCDLVRINGVGPAAAKTFYEAGYQSVSDVAKADGAQMLARVSKVNEHKQYYKAKLGIKDMQFCIDFANLLVNGKNL